MSRGFHAFFRQYYNLRSVLRRTDPTLERLRPLDDYPLVRDGGGRDSFSDIPRTPPWNLAAFVARSPSFDLKGLAAVDVDAALGLLDVDFPATFAALDGKSAADVLDRLRFPEAARHLALEVFARSFFADPREFSGAELVAMFHMYFVGSAEGLLFDVPRDDYDATLWGPLGAHLERLGVSRAHRSRGALGLRAQRAGRAEPGHLGAARHPRPTTARTGSRRMPSCLRSTRSACAAWSRRHPAWAATTRRVRRGGSPWPASGRRRSFAVWRLWLSGRVAPERPPVPRHERLRAAGQHLGARAVRGARHPVERGPRRLGRRAARLRPARGHRRGRPAPADAHRAAPGLPRDGGPRRSCTTSGWSRPTACWSGSSPGARGPGVRTPDRRVLLAGDCVRCDLPVALMERAATTGFLAADRLLTGWGERGHGVWSVPMGSRLGPVPRWARRGIRAYRSRGGAAASRAARVARHAEVRVARSNRCCACHANSASPYRSAAARRSS